MQFLVRATNDEWKQEANNLVLDLIGRKRKKKASNNPFSVIKDEIVDIVRYIAFGFFTVVNPAGESEREGTKEEESISLMLHLSPGEKDVVTAIDNSTKKPGFETDIRWMYLAKRDIFNKVRGCGICFSYFAQFGSQDLNYLHPDKNTKTSAYYFLTEFRKAIRKRKLLRKYKRREFDEKGYVLNVEELATIFHFPTIEVKAPVAPRVEARKSKPPSGLPM